MWNAIKNVPSRKQGRKPKNPLIRQVGDAFSQVHDLEWLQEWDQADLSIVQERVHPCQTMREAQALRGLLIAAALQAIDDIRQVANITSVKVFLERYLQGKRVSDIAKELGVSREWCSRSYRKEAFRLAAMRFVRSVYFSR